MPDPDIDHAAECLRRLAADTNLRMNLRNKARQSAGRQFDIQHFLKIAPSLIRPAIDGGRD